MEEVRNSAKRLVCRINKSRREVEIIIKGIKTTIQFQENGTVEIKNEQV